MQSSLSSHLKSVSLPGLYTSTATFHTSLIDFKPRTYKRALSNLLHGNRIVYPAEYLACTYDHLDAALWGLPQCISSLTHSLRVHMTT